MPAQAWVTLIVGLAAVVGVIITWRQKNDADRRAEWWRRTTWAFERTFSDHDTEAELGWKVLDTLVGSRLATRSDSDIVQVIAEHAALGHPDANHEIEGPEPNGYANRREDPGAPPEPLGT